VSTYEAAGRGVTHPGQKSGEHAEDSRTSRPLRFYEVAERRRCALRRAERAVDLAFDPLASLLLDRALVDLEMLAEGLP
jgi:hypothetical protein